MVVSNMSEITKGTWIVNTVKHLSSLKQNVSELTFFDATEQSGKAGTLLSKLVSNKEEIINTNKLNIYARQSSIGKAEIPTYLKFLKNEGKLDFTEDINNLPKEVEVYCFSLDEALKATSLIYDKLNPGHIDQASLETLDRTFQLPQYRDELIECLTKNGYTEEIALNTLTLQENFGLSKINNSTGKKIFFNEYAFTGNPEKAKRALETLSDRNREYSNIVLDTVNNNQGFLLENFSDNYAEVIKMLEGIGILDGITVESKAGFATFLTTPQIKGEGIGTFQLSSDVFHHAKILLSCLRFGETKSHVGRGKITSDEKLLNILNKLIRGEWIGPATAIGQDYGLLEFAGVVETKTGLKYGSMMRLRQKDVGILVKQMLISNKISVDDYHNSQTINLTNKPLSCIIPEIRKEKIMAMDTPPVIEMRENLLHDLRTGGRFS